MGGEKRSCTLLPTGFKSVHSGVRNLKKLSLLQNHHTTSQFPATSAAMTFDKSLYDLCQILEERCRSLEASHSQIKEQFEVLVDEQNSTKKLQEEASAAAGAAASRDGLAPVPGDGVYKRVLDCMGHAVFVSRPENGEIIYWSRPAGKLYGYKDWEVLGESVLELLVDEENYASAKKIMGNWNAGQSWSGQFPFKKRSGERFMALVTKSPLYEDGELVGNIIVSSDADVFDKMNSENLKANGQNRVWGLNLKRIQWPPQPQIASSVSNLASKVLLRKHGDESNECTTSGDRQGTILEPQDVTSEKLPKLPSFGLFSFHTVKKTFGAESSAKDESSSESAKPSKFAAKVLSKLTRNHGKEEEDDIQRHDSHDISGSNNAGNVPLDHLRHPMTTTTYHCDVDAELEKHSICESNPLSATKRSANVNLAILGELDERILEPDAVQQEADAKKFSSLDESNSGCNGTSLTNSENDLNVAVACEIRWEDISFCEEIGQGSFALV